MADPTANGALQEWRPSGVDTTWSGPIANGVTLYTPCLVAIQAGYANFWDDGGSDRVFCGLLLGEGIGLEGQALGGGARALTGDTSATPPPEVRVACGVILVGITVGNSPSQAKVGDLVYSADASISSITLNSSGRTDPIGWMCRYVSATDQDVRLFTPSEFLAQQTA